MNAMDLLDQAGNVFAILVPVGTVLYAIWRRIGGVLAKLDTAIDTQGKLAEKIDRLETHQHEINGGIIQHMKDDSSNFGELKAGIAHLEGRMDERFPRKRQPA